MPDPVYELPNLAYDYGALEPHISGTIMELHHGTHHLAYINGGNRAPPSWRPSTGRGNLSG